MGKRNFYFPPKAQVKQKRVVVKEAPTEKPGSITIGDDVRAELKKLADEYAEKALEQRKAEDLDNYIAFTLEALSRLGWTGKTRLNRFLSMLTAVSEEATNADDPPAYANEIKERLKSKGVKAFIKNDGATPQLEDNEERNDDE